MKKWGVLATGMLYSMASVPAQVRVRGKVVSLPGGQSVEEANNRTGSSLAGCTINADLYVSFISPIRVLCVGAAIGKYFAPPGLWLKAIGEAGYKTVGGQSLHMIPGEEYLSLMNTVVKKNFSTVFKNSKVAKGACLLEGDGTKKEKANDVQTGVRVLYEKFCKEKVVKGKFLVFTGHGNPESEYPSVQLRVEWNSQLKLSTVESWSKYLCE